MQAGSDMEKSVGRKVLVNLVVPCAFYILIGAIDRTNVGFAALQMNSALGMSGAEYGFGAGVLFAGYFLAKYPSVILFEAIGIRRWLALISLVWGVCATGMAFVDSKAVFILLRFAIGIAEAGLAAGLFLYLCNWASERFKASVLSFPIVAIPLAQVVGAPVSGWLLEADNPFHMEGWRWMFLIEGAPALVLAVFAILYFPNSPDDARWLNESERAWLKANVAGPKKPEKGAAGRWSALKNPVTWICAFIWFCLLAGNYGVIFWLPQILKNASGLSEMQIGWIVSLPWLGSAIGLVLNAWHSDAVNERYLHIGIPCAIAAAGLLTAYLIGDGVFALLALIIGGSFLGSTVAPFWAIPTKLLTPVELSVGVVAIHMFGSFAGLTIPAIIGALRDNFHSFGPPIYMISLILILALMLCLLARKIESGQALTTPELA